MIISVRKNGDYDLPIEQARSGLQFVDAQTSLASNVANLEKIGRVDGVDDRSDLYDSTCWMKHAKSDKRAGAER